MNTPQPPEPNMGDPGPAPIGLSDAEWLAALASDDSAPALLTAALSTTDPIPSWMLIGAQVAWQTRDLESELLGLLTETSSVGASRSVAAELRVLVFENQAETLRIEVSIRHDASGPVIDGILSGSAAADVSLARLSWQGSPAADMANVDVDVDRFGRFEILPDNATRARIRLSVNQSLANQSLLTPWFDVY